MGDMWHPPAAAARSARRPERKGLGTSCSIRPREHLVQGTPPPTFVSRILDAIRIDKWRPLRSACSHACFGGAASSRAASSRGDVSGRLQDARTLCRGHRARLSQPYGTRGRSTSLQHRLEDRRERPGQLDPKCDERPPTSKSMTRDPHPSIRVKHTAARRGRPHQSPSRRR